MIRGRYAPEQVWLPFLYCWFYCIFIVMGYLNITFVCDGQLMKIMGFVFSGDQEKKSCRIFWCWSFKGVTQEDFIF